MPGLNRIEQAKKDRQERLTSNRLSRSTMGDTETLLYLTFLTSGIRTSPNRLKSNTEQISRISDTNRLSDNQNLVKDFQSQTQREIVDLTIRRKYAYLRITTKERNELADQD